MTSPAGNTEPTPASAEPTEGDLRTASSLHECQPELDSGGHFCWTHDRPLPCEVAETTARALASQRAEIVARYEKVADEIAGWAESCTAWKGADQAYWEAADRIREAAPK